VDPLYRASPVVANFAGATLLDQSFAPGTFSVAGGVAPSTDFPLFGNTTARFPDGGSGRIEFNGSAIPFTGTPKTIEFWAYITSVNPNDISLIDFRDAGGANGIYIAVDSTGNVLEIGGTLGSAWSGAAMRSASGAVPVNAWAHYAFTLELNINSTGSSADRFHRAYIDGVQVAAQSGGSGALPTQSSTRMLVGDAFIPGYSLWGAMGPVRVTNHVRYPSGASFVPPLDIFPTSYGFPLVGLGGQPFRAATTGVPAAPVHGRAPGPLLVVDREFGGRGVVYGTVKVFGTPNFPKYARVRLVDEQTGISIRETWSSPLTGYYAFEGVDLRRKYTVLAYDPAKNLRAVVADNLTPEPM